ncbi:hypothetical protein AAHC03_05603 [Spirometra sp. Aus1]
MAVDEMSTTVDARDLWRTLSLTECLRFSPQFQLALKTGECEVEYLLEHYRIASDLFYRASKAGETFASALRALGGGLLSLLTPSTALPLISLDGEAAANTALSRLTILLDKLTDFSELTNTMAVNLYEPGVQLQTAAEQLEQLHPLRKAYSRAGDQLESTLHKSASVPRNRPAEAEEADSGLLDSRSAFSASAHSYLAALRAGLGPLRLANCLRCTFIVFRTEAAYAQGLHRLFQQFDYQVPVDWRGELERLLGASEEDARRGADQTSGPSIHPADGVLIEGNLFKRSHKKHWRTWDRRWFMVANNQLAYFTGLGHLKGGGGDTGGNNEVSGGDGSQAVVLKSLADTTAVSRLHWKIVEPDLRLCTAKAILSSAPSTETMAVQGQTQGTSVTDYMAYESSSLASSSSERRFTFELISPNGKKHYLQALNAEEMDQWVTILRAGLFHGGISVSATSLNNYQPRHRSGSPSPKSALRGRSASRSGMLIPQGCGTEGRTGSTNLSRSYDCLRTTGGALLLDDPPGTGNRLCADCASDRVSWASTNLGLTLCTDCAACHRGLGVHISKVRSLILDNWEPELIAVMRNLGNHLGGIIFEASLNSPAPQLGSLTVGGLNSSRDASLLTDGVVRPKPGQGSASNKQVRQQWIEMKYAKCQFVDFPGNSLADLKSRIIELYSSWRTQMQMALPDDNRRGGVRNDRSASPKSPVTTVLSGGLFGRVAKVVDRRRPSASPRLTSRYQLFLDNLLENLDVVAPLLQRSTLVPTTSTTTLTPPPVPDRTRRSTHRLSGSQLAARLILVAGAHMGCPPLVLLGLAAGASACAQPGAAQSARGLDLSAPRGLDPLGITCPPLIAAVIGGRISVCELLLSHGANIDETDADGQTALHHACSLQRVHLVCLLLRKRANATVRDLNGRLPIDLAYKTSNADIVTLLRLQPLKTDTSGESPAEVDEMAAEVFQDFTARAYNLQWDSDADDYREISR